MPPEAAQIPIAPQAPKGRPRSRVELSVLVATLHEDLATGFSLRQSAELQGVARSTLSHAQLRADGCGDGLLASLFPENPIGIAALHRLVIVLLVVVVYTGGLGVEKVRLILTLLGLAGRVACSPSHLRGRVRAMNDLMLSYEEEEHAHCAPRAPHRSFALNPDEMFRCGSMVLVAAEPVTGMVLVQRTAPHRDGLTWTHAIQDGMRGLHFTLYALCADCAGGIIRSAEEGLHVAFDPELFHGQKELTDAFSRPLRQRVKETLAASRKLAAEHLKTHTPNGVDPSTPVVPGSPVDVTERAEAAARSAHCVAIEDQHLLGEVRRGLGLALHPISLFTGDLRDAQTVDDDLRATLDRLVPVAARLGAKSEAAVARVRGLIPGWSRIIARWQTMAEERLAAEDLSPSLLRLLWVVLIPACYMAWVGARNHLPASWRTYLRAQSELLLRSVAADPEWCDLPVGLRAHLVGVAEACARLFVRSSSATEGLNGWLSVRLLRTHGVRDDWLAVLKVVHNYFLRRADGTTAAQRFYGRVHTDLVDYLCVRLPDPPLPRRRKPRPRYEPSALAA